MTPDEAVLVGSILVSMQIVLFGLAWYFLHKRQVWAAIKVGLTGHGSVVLKFLPDKGVQCLYSKLPVARIPWKIRNRATGKIQTYFQPIGKPLHHIAGTSIPLHICTYNSTSNISVIDAESKGLTDAEENDALKYAYFQGVIDTRRLAIKPGGFNLPLPIILGAIVFIIIVIMAWPTIAPMFGMK